MIDLDAPIIPAKSAAGISVGSAIETGLLQASDEFVGHTIVNELSPHLEQPTLYGSSHVDVWVKEGVVVQVGVHDGYRGKLQDVVGVGSTVGDIEDHIGAWEQDADDVLVIPSLPGLAFETPECPALPRQPSDAHRRSIPITWLFVYPPGLEF